MSIPVDTILRGSLMACDAGMGYVLVFSNQGLTQITHQAMSDKPICGNITTQCGGGTCGINERITTLYAIYC